LEKRGEGRFYQHNFKIPLYPPLPKGDKKPITAALPGNVIGRKSDTDLEGRF
jgi:hypothetical protein